MSRSSSKFSANQLILRVIPLGNIKYMEIASLALSSVQFLSDFSENYIVRLCKQCLRRVRKSVPLNHF